MLSKNLIKHITSLHQGKYQEIHHEFIAEGPKIVGELLHSRFKIKQLCATGPWLDENRSLTAGTTAEIFRVSYPELSRISALTSPNQVLAVFEITQPAEKCSIAEDELVLALEDIRDPGNLGTIVRIADWFGITKIICSLTSVDIYNPKSVQATMGSLARVEIIYGDIAAFIHTIPATLDVFAAALEGENIYTAELPKGGMIIIGNESHGISPEVLKLAGRRLFIPPFQKQQSADLHAESLNASVAAAILCYEFRKRV